MDHAAEHFTGDLSSEARLRAAFELLHGALDFDADGSVAALLEGSALCESAAAAGKASQTKLETTQMGRLLRKSAEGARSWQSADESISKKRQVRW